ncbi:MAG: RidA family protein, partial [Pseudomonadota bacterium]
LCIFDVQLDAEDRAVLDAALAGLSALPGDCGDEYRRAPFLTASGDLSDHLGALPPVFSVEQMSARPDRRRASSGSIYETLAGFSRAVRAGNRVVVSGTTATDPAGACVCPDDAGAQAVYILDKIVAAVQSLGGRREDIIRTRIYLTETGDWERVSAVHARYFGDLRPANTLIGGIALAGDGYRVEIEAEAEVG